MNIVMSAADLVVCRAGASTLSELTALGKPSILVPSPYVTANHQEHNARAIEKEGGARVILENEFTAEVLNKNIESLVSSKEKLKNMRRAAKSVGTTAATEEIYREAKRLLKNN
jgi:UDP-N-acetylglucosamine--N-acetylmuramyl-(pentapeptide) pyrophosphoryl-undecaprenol N-acetylglucosamine transferase